MPEYPHQTEGAGSEGYGTPRVTPIPAMPKEIAAALVATMRKVQRVVKDGRNEYGGYNYASVDAFLDMAGPLCAESGLIIYPVEISHSFDKIDDTRYAVTLVYGFELYHESGVGWTNSRDHKVVRGVWGGPQTFGALQSYALKSYMRALLKIPTGDRDADEVDQSVRIVDQQAPQVNAGRRARGRPTTGKILAFDLGEQAKTAVAVDEIANIVLPFLQTLPRASFKPWRDRHVEALQELNTLNKGLWLKIEKILDVEE